MKTELICGDYKITVFISIDDVGCELWNNTIGLGHPFRSHRYMQCVEAAFPKRSHRYFVVRKQGSDDDEIIYGLFFATLEQHDLTLSLSESVRRAAINVRKLLPNFATIKIGMAGCTETSEQHWWFEDDNYQDQVKIMDRCLKKTFKSANLLIVRDFSGDNDSGEDMLHNLEKLGYVRLVNHPLAKVKLERRDVDQHFERVKHKYTRIVKKAVRVFDDSDYSIHRITLLCGDVEGLHQQYLSVHERASEFKRHPIPLEFFRQLSEKLSDVVVVSRLEDSDSNIHGYVLSGIYGEVCCPFFFGRDYDFQTDVNVYYSLLYDVIRMAGEKRLKTIDLGITNYFVKQNLGAEVVELKMAAKFRGFFMNRMFTRYLPALLNVEQPPQKEIYKSA